MLITFSGPYKGKILLPLSVAVFGWSLERFVYHANLVTAVGLCLAHVCGLIREIRGTPANRTLKFQVLRSSSVKLA